jgi:ParB family chromosome partitioning protein
MPAKTGGIGTVEIEIDRIKVVPEDNPRGIVKPSDVTELVASVAENGVIQPVVCIEGPDGLELIAGYRRILAAEIAGVKKVPFHVRDAENRDIDALSENLPGLRQDMNDIAEARAMQRVISAKGLNQRKLAKRLGKSASYVGAHLRMLRLPKAVQDVYASGEPGIATVPAIEKISNASEEAGVRIANLAAKVDGAQEALRERPDRLVYTLEQVLAKERGTIKGEEGVEIPRPPGEGELVVLDLYAQTALDLYSLAMSEERRTSLAERFESLGNVDDRIQTDGEDYSFALGEADIDALRALGILLEYEDDDRWYEACFCFDSVALADRLEQLLDAAEAEAKERREAAQREADEAAKRDGEGKPEKVDPEVAKAEEEKEKKAEKRKEEKEAKEKKHRVNLALGWNLIKRRGRKRSAKRRKELIRTLALIVIEAEEHLAGLGPRLVYETWQEVDRKKLKSGKIKEKVILLDPHEATDRLRGNVVKAKTEDDILDEIGDALVAASYADEKELPMSRRVAGFYGGLRHGRRGAIRKGIDVEAQGVLPDELRKQLEKSQKSGYEESTFRY